MKDISIVYNGNDMNRTIKTAEQMEEIEEIKEFLGHIQPRVGEAAFAQIWKTVERLENRLNKSDCIGDVIDRVCKHYRRAKDTAMTCGNCGKNKREHDL